MRAVSPRSGDAETCGFRPRAFLRGAPLAPSWSASVFSDVISMFPTLVWRVELDDHVRDAIEARGLEALAQYGCRTRWAGPTRSRG
jgi:hypothetical protein